MYDPRPLKSTGRHGHLFFLQIPLGDMGLCDKECTDMLNGHSLNSSGDKGGIKPPRHATLTFLKNDMGIGSPIKGPRCRGRFCGGSLFSPV